MAFCLMLMTYVSLYRAGHAGSGPNFHHLSPLLYLLLISIHFSFSGYRDSVQYFINSGDPDGNFAIDPETGIIQTASSLDHETHSSFLLSIQAMSGDPPTYGHTQVRYMYIHFL